MKNKLTRVLTVGAFFVNQATQVSAGGCRALGDGVALVVLSSSIASQMELTSKAVEASCRQPIYSQCLQYCKGDKDCIEDCKAEFC